MSNLFQEVLNDANGVQSRLLGQTYPYYKNIKSPSQLGMGDKGTIQQMTKDIDGLVQYVELLVTGKSEASATGGPLGNKFFLQTGAKCAAKDTCMLFPAYVSALDVFKISEKHRGSYRRHTRPPSRRTNRYHVLRPPHKHKFIHIVR